MKWLAERERLEFLNLCGHIFLDNNDINSWLNK